MMIEKDEKLITKLDLYFLINEDLEDIESDKLIDYETAMLYLEKMISE